MLKSSFFVLLFTFVIIIGCSNDDDNPVNPPPVTGEILLATVSGDSAGTGGSGLSIRSSTVSSSTLNFTDRDSARISFYYSGQNNAVPAPIEIYYVSDTTNIYIYNSTTLAPTVAEQFVNVTVPSPRVNSSFKYRIASSSSNGIPSYFKFRELNIYKK